MINRAELKERGRDLMHQYYLKSVLFAFILTICMVSYQFSAGSGMALRTITRLSYYSVGGFYSFFYILFGLGAIAGLAIRFFLLKPLELGCRRYFVDSNFHDVEFEVVINPFYSNYQNLVKVMFFKELYAFLWGLLFTVPGIIKKYEYRMVPYLLLENPDIEVKEALERSKQMMMGHKKEAFFFDLSFFGWYVLSALSLGIAGIFFTNPYKACSDAQFYLAIRSMYHARSNAGAAYPQRPVHSRVY